MNKTTQPDLTVATRPTQELAPVASEPNVGQMLQAVIEKGVTADNVAAIEKLVDLYERMDNKRAEKDFNAAFVRLQKSLPVIVAQTEIKNRGKYERFEDVMHVVGPLLTANGFSVSFSQTGDDKRVTVTCHLRHEGGHSTETAFSVRNGVTGDHATQADCKASTTAKRNALLQCLNIVIRQDCLQDEDDPRNEGGFVTPEQAFELERRVNETNSDRAKFLKLAGAEKFAEIPAGKYTMLDEALARKERGV
jgi:hypothetical protein